MTKSTSMKRLKKRHFVAFERVRKSGEYNMITEARAAAISCDLSIEDYMGVLQNHEACMVRWPDVRAGGKAMIPHTITHFVGPRMDICGRIIQRCAVCGAKLCDSEGVMIPRDPDGTPGRFPTWPEGSVVRVTLGNPTHTELLRFDVRLPHDACIRGMDA